MRKVRVATKHLQQTPKDQETNLLGTGRVNLAVEQQGRRRVGAGLYQETVFAGIGEHLDTFKEDAVVYASQGLT